LWNSLAETIVRIDQRASAHCPRAAPWSANTIEPADDIEPAGTMEVSRSTQRSRVRSETAVSSDAGPAAAGTQGVAAAEVRYDPHGALQPLQQAGALTRARVAVLPVPMGWRPPGFATGRAERALKPFILLGAHLRLAARLWRRRDYDLVLVREFVTAFLLVFWPLIWPLRRRLCFLINHNLQEAHRRALERGILRLLYRTGIRLACLETTAGLAELGLAPDPRRILALPHPLGDLAPARPRADPARQAIVGVVGKMRAEKGAEEILQTLLDLRERGELARLMIACPEPDIRNRWRARGFEAIDTGDRSAYLEALDRCDVVILNYRRDRYFYRASGVAADAIARGALVICPDFPLLRHLLTEPAPVGALYAGLEDLGRAIQEALALRGSASDPWSAHKRARSPAAIAGLLDAFVERSRAPACSDANTGR
jgi:glycosyltransferase involved in cell wall biosynthesis